MTEIALSALQRQCPDRRLADRPAVEREVAAWAAARNAAATGGDWQFTTTDARTKLNRLYPTIRGGLSEPSPGTAVSRPQSADARHEEASSPGPALLAPSVARTSQSSSQVGGSR